MFPIRDDNPTELVPLVTLTIIAACVAVWLWVQGAGFQEAALRDLDRAIELDPEGARHYQNRSNVRCALGQVEGSVGDRLSAIRLGYFGADLVQSVLKEKGYYDGPVDGVFGERSVNALRAWTEKGCD